jgi:hypothetical protein
MKRIKKTALHDENPLYQAELNRKTLVVESGGAFLELNGKKPVNRVVVHSKDQGLNPC